MLLERLYYPNDYPIHIAVHNLVEDPVHYHPDIEIVYVLKGEVRLKNGYYTYQLSAGDIFVNSGNEVHSLEPVTADNILAQIHVRTRDLSHYFPNLSKACYRTYTKKTSDKRYDRLKEMVLQLLLKNGQKDFNYKSECMYLVVEIIKHLNKYFNLFAFDHDMVVGFDRSNQLTVERISHICTYIYQNYADNITLEDLAEMEHLSSYYISHLIKNFTGMNFRDFLCFARIEMSEARLLGSDRKISQIAQDVGFSTTAYYRKYFSKWFGHDPETHRKLYLHSVKSDLKPAVFRELPSGSIMATLREAYESYDSRQSDSQLVNRLSLEMDADADAKPLFHISKGLQVILTSDDFTALGAKLYESLIGLAPANVILRESGDTDMVEKHIQLLLSMGFTVEIEENDESHNYRASGVYAYDSILYPIWLTDQIVRNRKLPASVYLRDADSITGDILQGQSSVLTSSGIKKPSYYAFAALSRLKGAVIARGSQYGVIRTMLEGKTAFAVYAYNLSDALRNVCNAEMGKSEIKRMVDEFRDEISLSVNINLKPGTYSVIKYSLSRENTFFEHLAALDFRSDALSVDTYSEIMNGCPQLEAYIEEVHNGLNISFSMKGAGLQLTVIRQCGSR